MHIMIKIRVILVAFCMLTLIACNHLETVDNKKPDNKEPKYVGTFQTRTFIQPDGVGNKPDSDRVLPIAAIGAAMLPPLIDRGVDLIASSLRKASEDKVYTATALANGFFYKIDQESFTPIPYEDKEMRLIIVRGEFGPLDQDKQNFSKKFWREGRGKPIALNIGLNKDPAFYYEAFFQFTPDFSAFRLKSSFLECNEFIGKSISSKRDLVISFLFRTPSKDEKTGTSSFAIGTVKIEDLKTDTRLELEALNGHETAWLPLIPVSQTFPGVPK